MKNIWKIVLREIQLILHDSDVFLLALLAPLFYSLFYGSLYIYKTERDVQIAIVDCDETPMSRFFIRSLDAHELVTVSVVEGSMEEATNKLNQLDVQGIIYIQNRFEADLRAGKGVTIPVYLNTTRFLVSNDINKAVTSVGLTLAAGVRMNSSMAKGLNSSQARSTVEPLQLDFRPLFNTTESYGDFLIPALLVLILHQVLFLLFGQTFAKEREEKTLSSLYLLADKNIFKALMGKTLFYVVLFIAYSLLFYSVLFSLFQIPMRGSFIVLNWVTIIFLLTSSLWFLIIVSYFKRKILALQVIALTTYPLFLISGYSWPLSSLPTLLHFFALGIPLTPYLSAFSRIVFMGASIGDIYTELLHLVVLLCIAAVITYLRYDTIFKKSE